MSDTLEQQALMATVEIDGMFGGSIEKMHTDAIQEIILTALRASRPRRYSVHRVVRGRVQPQSVGTATLKKVAR